MRKLFQVTILFLVTIFAFNAEAQLANTVQPYIPDKNFLKNPGFEQSKSYWASATGTFSIDTSTKFVGKSSGKVVLSSATLGLTNVFTDSALSGVSLFGSVWVKSSNVAGIQLCITDNSVEISCSTTYDYVSGTWQQLRVNIPSGSTNALGLKLKSSASQTGTVYVDQAFLGPKDITQDVAQAEFVGSITYGSDCSFSRTSTSFGDFTADASCTTTVTGGVSAISGVLPGVNITSPKKGTYLIMLNGSLDDVTADGNQSFYTFTDGTSFFGEPAQWVNGIRSIGGGFSSSASYSSTPSSLYFKLQCKVAGGAGSCVYGSSYGYAQISVFYFPPVSKIISDTPSESFEGYFGNQTNCSPLLGTTVDSGVWNNVADTDCTTLTSSQGSATAIGSGNIGFYKNLKAGKYLVIFSAHEVSGYTSAGDVYQRHRIAYCSGTSTCSSGSYVYMTDFGQMFTSGAYLLQGVSILIAGIANVTSDGNWSFHLQESTQSVANLNANYIRGDTNERISFTLIPIETLSSLKLSSANMTYGATQPVIYSAKIAGASVTTACSSSPCTTYDETGDWISSVTRSGAGTYTVNLNSGYFTGGTGIPTCECNAHTGYPECYTFSMTSSSFGIYTSNSAGTLSDTAISLICHGQK